MSQGTGLTQDVLIRRAFAGDDVVAAFDADKAAEAAAELPAIDEPVVLPGWGAWAGPGGVAREPRWAKEARAKAQR